MPLIKDYLVLEGYGFVRNSRFLAAAGGWVLSFLKQRHKKTTKTLQVWSCALILRAGTGQGAFHPALFDHLFARSCWKGFTVNLLFMSFFQ